MAAFVTAAGGIVFKELYGLSALGTIDFKDGTGFPKSAVLTGTFHKKLQNGVQSSTFKVQSVKKKVKNINLRFDIRIVT